MKAKKVTFLLFICILFIKIELISENSDPVKFNPWELIIYRPENNYEMNDIRCWLTAYDAETGEDVTYTKIKAKYEWVSQTKLFDRNIENFESLFIPGKKFNIFEYRRTYYLSGGMAMHLNIQKGKYRFVFNTPIDKQNNCVYQTDKEWISNEFFYDTENPTKVIFLYATVDENGFYNGSWLLDYKLHKDLFFPKNLIH